MDRLSHEGRIHELGRSEQGGEMTEDERAELRRAVTTRDLTTCLEHFRSKSAAEVMEAFENRPDRETEALARVVDLLIGHITNDDELQRKLGEIKKLIPPKFQPRRTASRAEMR